MKSKPFKIGGMDGFAGARRFHCPAAPSTSFTYGRGFASSREAPAFRFSGSAAGNFRFRFDLFDRRLAVMKPLGILVSDGNQEIYDRVPLDDNPVMERRHQAITARQIESYTPIGCSQHRCHDYLFSRNCPIR